MPQPHGHGDHDERPAVEHRLGDMESTGIASGAKPVERLRWDALRGGAAEKPAGSARRITPIGSSARSKKREDLYGAVRTDPHSQD